MQSNILTKLNRNSIILLLLVISVNGQLSKANEPCASDADCVPEWESCSSSESICVHKD